MGTLLDLASLVVVPSGYKAGTVYSVVPTDGAGDLTFTRSLDTATRVGPDGLIEKVRTNVVLQSNTFNTTWASAGGGTTTATIGATDPNGGATAWTLAKTGAAGRIEQFPTLSGQVSLSIFAKAGTLNGISISNDVGNISCNLTNGAIALSGASGSAVSVGNGWFRITMTTATNGNAFRIYPSDANGDVSGTSGNILIFNSQKESGDIATPYIPTTTASVSVGMLANVPRLDYTGGGCPKLLLEPQRSNLAFFSENFNNAYWTKTGGTTITANTTISPDGFLNADTIAFAGSGDSINLFVSSGLSVVSGTTYTMSVFTKSTTQVIFFGGATGGTGTNVFNGSVDYGNGWYRQSVTRTYSASGSVSVQLVLTFNTAGTSAIAYGFQAELGSYPTSYIPTLGAAVTRSADAASKTGISALIGQTEGTLFIDFVWNGLTGVGSFPRIIELATDANNIIQFYSISGTTTWGFDIINGGVVQFTGSSTMALGRNKFAFGYKVNDMVVFKNGTLVASDASCSVPATSSLGVTGVFNGTGGAQLAASVNQTLLFKTRLTNTQLIELTTL